MSFVPFLKEVALWLLEKEENNLQSVCVVFPNKRARLYLSKYISQLTKKPVWAPQYLTISELLESISGYTLADRLSLVFELYKSYGRVTGSTESFDRFYPYSDTLLADYDEADKYLANVDDLFSNLAGLKLIDGKFNYLTDDQIVLISKFWNTFDPDHISKDQTVFINLWESLSGIYHDFRSNLEAAGLAYEGMAYRKAIDIIKNDDTGIFTSDHYVFVGFNALNKCEEKLFYHLRNAGKADFFWDYDDWYVNNDIHEAGYFIRSNVRNFPPAKPLKTAHLIEKKNQKTFFIPVYSNSGQASMLSSVFDKMGITESDNIERTAVVLADENLLMPVLYSIPESVTEINVTMGYPVSGSAVFALFDTLYDLAHNARKSKEGIISWYYSDVLAITGNPLTRFMYESKADTIRDELINRHISYVEQTKLPFNENDPVFSESVYDNTCKYLLDIVPAIIRNTTSEKQDQYADPVLSELLFQVYTSLTRLQDIISASELNPGYEVLFKLIRKMLGSLRIPFSGEPLAGLQVLGILETRTLDFDHVILLSANEGILPRSSEKPSFIPYNLRSGFGLPTPEFHDAIYAYYFYRLIQRARHVALIYDAGSGGLKTGERSRYLHQLEYEMRLPVQSINTEFVLSAIPVKPVIVEKSEPVKEVLQKYTGRDAKILSPSAINEFLNCQIRFYFHHIAGIPQPEKPGEEIDARMFGNILHHALAKIYEEFGNSIVTADLIKQTLNREEWLELIVYKAFCGEMYGNPEKSSGKPEGYNIIITKVILSYIRQFLKAEMDSCPFTISSLEQKLEVGISVNLTGENREVKVGGIIDRIDLREGKIRILDYKTGSLKDRFENLDSLFESSEKLRNDAVFQVFLYAYVYKKLYPYEKVQPGLFFMRQSHSENFSWEIKQGSRKEIILDFDPYHDAFEEKLIAVLHKIFDDHEPFIQTTNHRHCMNCPYAMICRRDIE